MIGNSPFPEFDYTGRTVVVDLPHTHGTWEILTRPTQFDIMRLSEFLIGLEDTAAALSKQYGYKVAEVFPALGAMTTHWSFDEAVTVETIMARDMYDLKTVLEVFEKETIPFIRQVATEEQLKAYSLPSNGNRASRRNGRKPTSSRRRGGRTRTTSERRKTQ